MAETAWDEPEITVNGTQLTLAQAMTVRVALQTFALGLHGGLGDDDTGKAITAALRRPARPWLAEEQA